MSRKFKSYRKYNYNQGAQVKKIVLIVLAVVLVVAAAVVAFSFFGKEKASNRTAYLELLASPEKTTYYVGEAPSYFGMKARYVTADGNVVDLGPESCTFTGFDSSTPVAEQVITVKYKEYTDTFIIKILDKAVQKPEGLFTGMTFKSKPKTQYKVGQWLSVEGGVLLLQYDDGTTKELALNYDMVHDFTTAAPGTYTVTVMYMEDGYLASVDFTITVME